MRYTDVHFYRNCGRSKVINPVKGLLAAETISQIIYGIFKVHPWVEKYYDEEFISQIAYKDANGSYWPWKWDNPNEFGNYVQWWIELPLWAKIKILNDGLSMLDEDFDVPNPPDDLSSWGLMTDLIYEDLMKSRVMYEVVSRITISQLGKNAE